MSGLLFPTRFFAGYIFDLDGTVYLGEALLPRARETLLALRARGLRTIFISNNPTHPRADYAAKLTRLGVPTPVEDILTSTFVMVDFLQRRMPGARLFVDRQDPGGVVAPVKAARTTRLREWNAVSYCFSSCRSASC